MTDEELAREALAPLLNPEPHPFQSEFNDAHSMTKETLLKAVATACAKARAEGREDVTLDVKPPAASLPWKPHDGPPHMNATEAMRLYHEKRSAALSRTVMTDEQRAEFVGDAKPT